MKIYKFGGASVKDANGVRNLSKVLRQIGANNTVLIVSAMGKMTNAFENIVDFYFNDKKILSKKLEIVKEYHYNILNELFKDKTNPIFNQIDLIWTNLSEFIIKNNITDYNFVYDQIVSVAEIVSTKIISTFLISESIDNKWIDAKEFIKTNNDYREGKVDWNITEDNIRKLENTNQLIITQGFIASDKNGNTTTLGREGSDYTAAIFAYCLNAESVTIFKDVAGVLNADPRVYNETVLLSKISYREAIEMAFYGASVIHPKTLQPLQKKEIPLYVKSFINPLEKGTVIKKGIDLEPMIPCYIVKDKQILVSISTRDFSFMMENDISEIFDLLHRFKLRVNLIQNTAISFSVCLEDKYNNFANFLSELKVKYKGLFNKNVTLLTIRHFDTKAIASVKNNNEILVQQTSRETVQFVVGTIKK